MILSLQRNYIYIRTKKTGSSTIEEVLRGSLVEGDIVVKTGLECLRPVLKPGAILPQVKGPPTHVAISELRSILRDDFWAGAFKFTSERHPYEKAVSLAYWRLERKSWARNPAQREAALANCSAYLDRIVRAGKYSTFRHYSIGGSAVVDDFIRLENLHADVQRIAARIQLPLPNVLPQKRAYSRADRRPAREILTDEQKQIVWEHCQREFEVLGYER
jgi:hypothetical protein